MFSQTAVAISGRFEKRYSASISSRNGSIGSSCTQIASGEISRSWRAIQESRDRREPGGTWRTSIGSREASSTAVPCA